MMKKILLTLAISAGVISSCFAQKSTPAKFSIGIEPGMPVGSARDVSTFTIGGSLKYDLPVASKTWFTVAAGYTYFPYKNDITVANVGFIETNSGEGFVPLKAGIKYFISSIFYAEGQVGAAISTSSGGGTRFAYAPGIGYQFDTRADLGIRYEGWSKNNTTISQVAMRLAYSF
ncbi:outer membrane beta-barrel protein [Mucilaginibacter sp. UR6-11]|uniref:outer membrane beta-barrel protein n=1 Tax=Mucilaginibacter sp. UR6-11 TaxID=1435644 RepID=UPI001E61D038|nr:outer membrane beta-barrel protein [Mucilaginibacter sp. UR6-11]MCC8424028.1 DUF481 domain-containing protein [Mucilaginibacter sp. UR6-11]